MNIPVPAVGIGQTRETDLDHCILNTLKNVRLQNLHDHPNSALFENYPFFLISAKTSFCYIVKSAVKRNATASTELLSDKGRSW